MLNTQLIHIASPALFGAAKKRTPDIEAKLNEMNKLVTVIGPTNKKTDQFTTTVELGDKKKQYVASWGYNKAWNRTTFVLTPIDGQGLKLTYTIGNTNCVPGADPRKSINYQSSSQSGTTKATDAIRLIDELIDQIQTKI